MPARQQPSTRAAVPLLCPVVALIARSTGCADDRPLLMRRRTRYSLIGRATLGVKATHQKLRLGAEPRGAPQSLTAGRQCSLNRLLLRALLSVTHTDTPRVLLSPEMLRGGMSQRSAECPCSTAS
jgi:hypothetical protein